MQFSPSIEDMPLAREAAVSRVEGNFARYRESVKSLISCYIRLCGATSYFQDFEKLSLYSVFGIVTSRDNCMLLGNLYFNIFPSFHFSNFGISRFFAVHALRQVRDCSRN